MTRRYRSKARLRSYARRIALFAVLLTIIFVFTYPYLRTAFLKATIPIGRGRLGALEESVSGEAVFAGGFAEVPAPAPGTLRLLVADGASVRTGEVIAEVVNLGNAEAFRKSLEFAKAQLADYEEKTDGEFRELSSSLQATYGEAVDLFFSVETAKAAGQLGKAYEYEAYLASREKTLREYGDRLSQIEEERARLARNVAGIEVAQAASAIPVYSPASGVFTTEITPIDSKFTPERVSGMSAPELATLAREAKEVRAGEVKDGQRVETGDVIGKVVSGQGVSFYLPVKTEDKPEMTGRSNVDLVIGSGPAVTAEISEVLDGLPPGYSIIVGSITVMPSESLVKAGQVGLTVRRRSGVIIPKSGLLEKGGRQGVLKVQKTYARFREVEVLMTKGDQAVVRGISETDEIVLKAMSFLEGRRVR